MDLQKIKTHLIAFLAHAVGGPVRYAGAIMRRAHGHLHIEHWHFVRFANHFTETLRELAVPERLAAAVMARVRPLARQIVNGRTLSAAAD
jgi:hemoglobin